MFGDNTNDNANGGQQPFAGDQPTLNTPVSNASPATTAPAVPSTSEQPDTSTSINPPAADTNNQTEVTTYGAPTVSLPTDNASRASNSNVGASSGPTVGGNDALLDIKQQALQQLTPLVDHLEQTPQEEFRTTMMMIQATDNQELVKKAFEAAQKIEDDKERAQAFLDIINEINYFTQHHEQQ